jgi:hypothetical protein
MTHDLLLHWCATTDGCQQNAAAGWPAVERQAKGDSVMNVLQRLERVTVSFRF